MLVLTLCWFLLLVKDGSFQPPAVLGDVSNEFALMFETLDNLMLYYETEFIYEVRTDGETLVSIARLIYGFESFSALLEGFNSFDRKDQLKKDTTIIIPSVFHCENYMEETCLLEYMDVEPTGNFDLKIKPFMVDEDTPYYPLSFLPGMDLNLQDAERGLFDPVTLLVSISIAGLSTAYLFIIRGIRESNKNTPKQGTPSYLWLPQKVGLAIKGVGSAIVITARTLFRLATTNPVAKEAFYMALARTVVGSLRALYSYSTTGLIIWRY